MSLFASLEQSGTWSITGISFESPVNDILDKGDGAFTLEDLLQEDDLLQEIKSRNNRLLDFLESENTVAKLVSYLVSPAESDASDLRIYKYPCISCEVICCEVPKILDALSDEYEGKYLRRLFTILDCENSIDHYLAGYFEKVLEVLFRKKTIALMTFLNQGGTNLLKKFLYHIDNYSIMQIVQRVLLPHIPFVADHAEHESLVATDKYNAQCNWSFIEDTCVLLCDRMLEHKNIDVPSHISDLLITVLQLSPPDSQFLRNLCEPVCLNRLLVSAFINDAETASVYDTPSFSSVVSVAALSVLESLISRLCEALNPYDIPEKVASFDDQLRMVELVTKCIEQVSGKLLEYIPTLSLQLNLHNNKELPGICGTFPSQVGKPMQRLGPRGLRLVKLVESIVRLSNNEINALLAETGVLSICVRMMFLYEMNSLLHLSVQRIVLVLLESNQTSKRILWNILIEDDLIIHIMDILKIKSSSDSDNFVDSATYWHSRSPLAGHLIVIGQGVLSILHPDRYSLNQLSGLTVESPNDSQPAVNTSMEEQDLQYSLLLKSVLEEASLYNNWEEFIQHDFAPTIEVQTSIVQDTKNSPILQLEGPLPSSLQDSVPNSWIEEGQGHENEEFDDDDDYYNYGRGAHSHHGHMSEHESHFVDFGSVLHSHHASNEDSFAHFNTAMKETTNFFPEDPTQYTFFESTKFDGDIFEQFPDNASSSANTDFFGSSSFEDAFKSGPAASNTQNAQEPPGQEDLFANWNISDVQCSDK